MSRRSKNRTCVLILSFTLLVSIEVNAGWGGHFENRLMIGPGVIAGSSEKLGEIVNDIVFANIILDIGWQFDNGFSFHLEGQVSTIEITAPTVAFGSVVGSYHFLDRDSIWDPYALLGFGYGLAMFWNEHSDDLDSSGPFEFQLGCGVTYHVLSWLELGFETRLRIGVPNNPDVIGMGFLGVFVFKLPDLCDGKGAELADKTGPASERDVGAGDKDANPAGGDWPVDADYRVGMGIGIVVGNESKMNQRASEGPWDAVIADLGYGFGGGWAVHAEFQIWNQMMQPASPLVLLGSLVMSYSFFQDEFFVEPYALAGIGYGLAEYYGDVTKGLETHEDRVDTGPFHFQLGGGATFHLLPFLDLGLETRLRIGVPDNPDVVGMSFLGVLRLRPCRICP